MDTTADSDPRAHRRLVGNVKASLRSMRGELALLNRQVGVQLEIKDIDLDCLDLITEHGPLGPSELARRAGLHPATMTGILDRLERAGWIVRERAAKDRRAVAVRALPHRAGEVYAMFAGMNSAMDELCADYSSAELELLACFLTRVSAAAESAAADLASD